MKSVCRVTGCAVLLFTVFHCNTTSSKIPFQKENYRTKKESLLYVFRERAFIGGGVETVVFFDDISVGLLPQKAYYPIHTVAGIHKLKVCSGNIVASTSCQEKELSLRANDHMTIGLRMKAGNDFSYETGDKLESLAELQNEGNFYDAAIRDLAPRASQRITLSAAALGAKGQAALKVAILNFSDQTKSEVCGWLAESLPDAIDQSMRRDFVYVRPSPAAAQKVARQAEGKSAKERAGEMGVNLVISGRYTLNENQSSVHIEAQIYDADGDKIIGTEGVDASLDSQIFNATKLLSEKLVGRLHALVKK